MEIKKIKILVVTYIPWSNSVSVGNSLTNIFNGMGDHFEFGNIYFRDDKPSNDFVSCYFKISEKGLFKSMFSRRAIGEVVDYTKVEASFSDSYNNARRLRWDIFLLLQDCIGLFGVWQSKALDDFVKEFKPDLIFGPLGRIPVTNNLMSYIGQRHKIPIITYPWDDHYSLKKLSFSPIFWIKTFVERKAIKKCAQQSDLMYTITEKMKDEYSNHFNKNCKLLYKGYDFVKEPLYQCISNPIKILYMGNIGDGRWNVLAKVASSLSNLNKGCQRVILDIYTLSPFSNKIKSLLEINGSSYLKQPVESKDILKTMQSADILLFVEPTKLKQRLFFRLSFSTKLVDYFYNAKCILAIGGKTASMDYLIKNDAAIVEYNINNIERRINQLLDDRNLIDEYARKSWLCGLKNHQINQIHNMLLTDFKNIINSKSFKNEY
jgi:hypothetical protein